MIVCEVTTRFTLDAFDKIKIIKRKSIDTPGTLYVGDIFECDEDMARYLTGGNKYKEIVVKIVEVLPEKVESLTDNEEIQSFIGYTQIIKESKKPKKKKNK